MMEKTCLFLDTTIQIEKVLAGKERKSVKGIMSWRKTAEVQHERRI
jgi:hypothetical protein